MIYNLDFVTSNCTCIYISLSYIKLMVLVINFMGMIIGRKNKPQNKLATSGITAFVVQHSMDS